MSERPILFNSEMVRAVLDGRKTQTRRVVKPQPVGFVDGVPSSHIVRARSGHVEEHTPILCPFGVPGDTLWPAMPIESLGRNYCADTAGAIWSRARDGATWRRLKGSPTSKGYLTVTPAVDGKYRTRLVHRLVAEAFHGLEPRGLRQVRHLDGDQTNNRPENLDWGTQQDNWSDRLVHGRGQREHHHAARLTEEKVRRIRASDSSQRYLSAEFGVSQATIWCIKNQKIWVDNPQANPPNYERWASRISLEVTDVRVERVQDISEEDAQAEGARGPIQDHPDVYDSHWHRDGFRALWDSVNLERGHSWDTKSRVWAVTFKRI